MHTTLLGVVVTHSSFPSSLQWPINPPLLFHTTKQNTLSIQVGELHLLLLCPHVMSPLMTISYISLHRSLSRLPARTPLPHTHTHTHTHDYVSLRRLDVFICLFVVGESSVCKVYMFVFWNYVWADAPFVLTYVSIQRKIIVYHIWLWSTCMWGHGPSVF